MSPTGYSAQRVLGRNCRFLQGTETSREACTLLRDSVRDGKPVECELLNYRKDGSRFRNLLSMKPIWECSPVSECVKRAAFIVGRAYSSGLRR